MGVARRAFVAAPMISSRWGSPPPRSKSGRRQDRGCDAGRIYGNCRSRRKSPSYRWQKRAQSVIAGCWHSSHAHTDRKMMLLKLELNLEIIARAALVLPYVSTLSRGRKSRKNSESKSKS